MTCSRCGAEMNHQADKLVQPVTEDEAAVAARGALDGIVEHVFSCPSCGWIDSQRALTEPIASG